MTDSRKNIEIYGYAAGSISLVLFIIMIVLKLIKETDGRNSVFNTCVVLIILLMFISSFLVLFSIHEKCNNSSIKKFIYVSQIVVSLFSFLFFLGNYSKSIPAMLFLFIGIPGFFLIPMAYDETMKNNSNCDQTTEKVLYKFI